MAVAVAVAVGAAAAAAAADGGGGGGGDGAAAVVAVAAAAAGGPAAATGRRPINRPSHRWTLRTGGAAGARRDRHSADSGRSAVRNTN